MDHLNPLERALKSRLDSYQPNVKADWNSFSKKLPNSGGLSSAAKWMIGTGAGVAAVVGGIAYNVWSADEATFEPQPQSTEIPLVTTEESTEVMNPNNEHAEETIVLFDQNSKEAEQNEDITVVTNAIDAKEKREMPSPQNNSPKTSENEVIREKIALQFNVPQVFCVNVPQKMSLDPRAENVVWDFGNAIEFGNAAAHTFKNVGKHRVELSYMLDGKKESKYFDVNVQGAADLDANFEYFTDLDHGTLALENNTSLDLTWYINGVKLNNRKETEFPVHEHGKYEVALKGTDLNGCPVLKTDKIQVKEIYKVIHPNSFTPGNDGNNDVFMPVFSEEVNSFVLIISDLKGNVVYETKDLNHPWDGKLKDGKLASGLYAWSLILKSPNGSLEKHNGRINVL